MGNFNAQQSPFFYNAVVSQIDNFSQTYSSKCINFVDKTIVNSLFWTLYFDGSKSEDGVGAGCILISQEGEKTMLACRLEFYCTSNITEYEALIQGLYKAIDLDIKDLKVSRDSNIIVKQVRNTIHCHFGRLKHYQ